VTSSVRTQQIRYMNPDWTYPARGAVLAVADNVGSMIPTMDVTINSLSLKGVTGSVGELTYDGRNLLVNGEPITATTGDMSGDTIHLGQLVLTASGDYIRVKSETAEYVIRPGGGGGATGSVGPRGAMGMTGPAGRPGPVGATGSPGLLGPTGPAGVAGVMGATGVTGPAGSVGPRGASGLQGIMGPTGAAGLGVTGATGGAGPIGPTGLRGVAGVTGPTGPTGAMQPAGTPGTYLSPTSITTNVYGQITDISGVGHSIANGTYAYPTSITTEGGYVKAISASTNVVASVAGTDGIGVTGGTGRNPVLSLTPAGPGAATYTSPTSLTLDAYGRVAGVSTSGATTLSSVVVTGGGGYLAPSIRWASNTAAGLYYLGNNGVAMCSSAGPVCYINQDGFNVEGSGITVAGEATFSNMVSIMGSKLYNIRTSFNGGGVSTVFATSSDITQEGVYYCYAWVPGGGVGSSGERSFATIYLFKNPDNTYSTFKNDVFFWPPTLGQWEWSSSNNKLAVGGLGSNRTYQIRIFGYLFN
jgi:hypothetical protein